MSTKYNIPYFVIEHNETDFPANGWCVIEYTNILRIVGGERLIITKMSPAHVAVLPACFKECAAITEKSFAEFIEDPVEDSNIVLANINKVQNRSTTVASSRVCFLDEQGTGALEPADITAFDYIILGGILGDHPPKDVGGYLRAYPFAVRHLGDRQMSTDTAALACATILRHQVSVDKFVYADDPEVYSHEIDLVPNPKKSGRAESTAIRMRYLMHQQPDLQPAVPLVEELKDSCCHWELSKTEPQKHLSTANVNVPRITPDLLNHIFNSADDAIFDFDAPLEFAENQDFTEEELAEMNKALFDY